MRDLPRDQWNVDLLLVLTEDDAKAHELAQVAQREEWRAEVLVQENREEVEMAMGMYPCSYGVFTAWWD